MFPLWLKVAYTLFVGLLVLVYWARYGPANFLWFSDIALLLTVPALWWESGLLASMSAVSVLLLEMAWNADFLYRWLTGKSMFGLSRYMFDTTIELPVRALSLFHVVLPPLLLWMVYRLGYDERALLAQTFLAWVVLPLSYWFAKPSENVNWVRGLRGRSQTWMSGPAHLVLLMLGLPVIIYLPTHFVLKKLFE